jgi:hypothetical protein
MSGGWGGSRPAKPRARTLAQRGNAERPLSPRPPTAEFAPQEASRDGLCSARTCVRGGAARPGCSPRPRSRAGYRCHDLEHSRRGRDGTPADEHLRRVLARLVPADRRGVYPPGPRAGLRLRASSLDDGVAVMLLVAAPWGGPVPGAGRGALERLGVWSLCSCSRTRSATRSSACFALMGWRPGRMWLELGIALTVMGVADAIYSVQVPGHAHDRGSTTPHRRAPRCSSPTRRGNPIPVDSSGERGPAGRRSRRRSRPQPWQSRPKPMRSSTSSHGASGS